MTIYELQKQIDDKKANLVENILNEFTGLNVYVFHSKFNLTLTVGGDCVMTVSKKGTTYDDKFIREDKVSKIERLYIDTYGELE